MRPEFPYVSWNLRSTKFVPRTYSPKSIVKPDAITQAWVHHPYGLYNGCKETDVDPDLGKENELFGYICTASILNATQVVSLGAGRHH